MARAAIKVSSLAEADAMKLALAHPTLKAAAIITGQLLQLPSDVRASVMQIVESSLVLVLDDEPRELTSRDGDEPLRLHDGGDRDTGE